MKKLFGNIIKRLLDIFAFFIKKSKDLQWYLFTHALKKETDNFIENEYFSRNYLILFFPASLASVSSFWPSSNGTIMSSSAWRINTGHLIAGSHLQIIKYYALIIHTYNINIQYQKYVIFQKYKRLRIKR